MSEKKSAQERELPHTDLLQAILPICFTIIWILDSMVFEISIWLNNFVPSWLRFILFICIFTTALTLIYLSHKQLFKNHEAPDRVLTSGLLGHVRNPLYLGVYLIYVALICMSISIICIVFAIIIFILFNKIANYEENVLDKLFGEEFREYKKKVPKWIPSIKRRIN